MLNFGEGHLLKKRGCNGMRSIGWTLIYSHAYGHAYGLGLDSIYYTEHTHTRRRRRHLVDSAL